MRRIFVLFCLLGLAGFLVFWRISAPTTLPPDALDGMTADVAHGAQVFDAAGCASCHTAPKAETSARPQLSGGQRFASPFGTFLAPNISPDPTHGIGSWSTIDLANAMTQGVSPQGAHYYPAFPYTTYARANLQDIVDLKAFLDTLPADATPSLPHEIGFPFNIRRSLGGWKWLFADSSWVMSDVPTPELTRGRYLVEALGHCGECHTPRNALGATNRTQWLTGAPNPTGKGKIPGITASQLDWSTQDLAFYFETGFTPEYDNAGGHMALVIENLAKLSAEDRLAIVAYLKALP